MNSSKRIARPGVAVSRRSAVASAAAVFGKHGVSLNSVVQKASQGEKADIAYVTHVASEAAISAALAEISELDVVEKIAAVIRVEEL